MINIKRYREWLIELKESINKASEDARIEGIAIAVHEGHMLRKLRDRRGVVLCAKYPDAKTTGNVDNHSADNDILLFLLEKVPSGQHDDEEELTHYARLQELVDALLQQLLDGDALCGDGVPGETFNVEWEYDIFGGWNGLSVSFKLNTE